MSALRIYKCNDFLNNFNYGDKYIRVDNGDSPKTGLYINNKYELECISDGYFTYSEQIHSIKKVVAIYSNNNTPIKIGNVYSVFKLTDTNYRILADNLRMTNVSKDFFLDKEDCDKMSKEEFELAKEKIANLLESDEKQRLQKEKEIKEIEEKKKLIKEQKNLIESVCDKINNSLIISKTIYKENVPKSYKLIYFFYGTITLLISILFKNPIAILISAFSLFITIGVSKEIKNTKYNEKYDIDINHYERLKFQNTLPLNLLGKIKQVENELIILNYMKVNNDILKLLQESINLTIYISTDEKYYLSHKEELDDKLIEFLDNTLKYIETLKDNRKIEEIYIKGSISKDILSMIDKNNELLKDLIKDNHYLVDIYNNVDIEKFKK